MSPIAASRLRQLLVLSAVAAAFLLSACGGGEDGEDSTAATRPDAPSATPPPGRPGEGGAGASEGEDTAPANEGEPGGEEPGGGNAGGSSRPQKPASLATEPGSIQGARVTATGAVQTLPPSDAGQTEAMENSYGSIRSFGEESAGTEATDITFALLQYLNARAEGDWATACARLYSVLRQNLEKASGGAGCAAAYGSLMSRVSPSSRAEAAQIDVASVRRGDDDRAFVIYKTPATLSADMPMYLDGGVWTVGALEAYALTPEQLEENRR